MIKTLLIVLSILPINSTLAIDKVLNTTHQAIVDMIDPPSSAALNIMVSALTSLKELKKQKRATKKNIEALTRLKILPNIAINVSTKIALNKYWDNLNIQQKQFFKYYISESLIQDYVGILSSYDKLNSVHISVDPNVKRKNDKAIVRLIININNDPKPSIISLKMIRFNTWRVYDIVFSGISIVKNYREQFNSYIKRKSIDDLIRKSKQKLKKIAK
ncbi:MlaC/ttg2D family ABC transporter substrate-binding protein [Candidatus Vesicomyidisocius sp. SY067_SCS001]|uniref:MlaC/ttg2D family ABC transporter substrate-binding protein n=1 Tax=Candidatus Vesicomyidisocius sp. SY067_SCS001 TaxID=2732590 RepID=UPI0016893344|nr:ABC transporter substrate-binding protein [Candidatus Vesicomyosocius sp. SY067_SCS001]